MLDFGFYNMDCMEGMKEFPNKYFDLAIVDPPYGGGSDEYDSTKRFRGGTRFRKYFDGKKQIKAERRGGQWASKYGNNICEWDVAPTEEYFEELFRISKSQIIWGGNYFALPPTRCFIIWRKSQIPEQFSMSMCEYAWTSFNSNAKLFECPSFGDKKDVRFHPTQKPIALYRWILANYAKQGDKLLDTHVGSASSLIAFEERGFDYVGFEIDADYYQKAQKRLEENRAQISMDFLRKLP